MLHVGPVPIEQGRSQCGVQLEIDSLGAPALFGLSGAELPGELADLAETGRAELAVLPERLRQAVTWAERLAVLEAVLTAVLQRAAPGRRTPSQ